MFTKITERIAKLQEFQTQTPPDPRVQEALRIIRSVMRPSRSILTQNNTLSIVYGSLIFHDPHNLDVDLELVGISPDSSDKMLKLSSDKNFRFDDVRNWPRTRANYGQCNAHVSYTSIEETEKVLRKFSLRHQSDNWRWEPNPTTPEEEDRQWDFDSAATSLGIVLTGKSLYQDQASLHQEMKNRTWRLIESYPLIREPIAHRLQDCIEVREERRNKR